MKDHVANINMCVSQLMKWVCEHGERKWHRDKDFMNNVNVQSCSKENTGYCQCDCAIQGWELAFRLKVVEDKLTRFLQRLQSRWYDFHIEKCRWVRCV